MTKNNFILATSTTRVFNTINRAQNAIDLYLGSKDGRVRSMELIAQKYGTTVASVRRILVVNGVTIRGRGRVAQFSA
jgi:intergrase/recombinase